MALLVSKLKPCVCWSRLVVSTSVCGPSSISLQKVPNRNVAVKSVAFPEYDLIFAFNKIRAAGRFNRMKLQATLLVAGGTPAAFLINQLGYITPETFTSFVFCSSSLMVFMHAVGFLFNNTIGYIYLKNDGQTVKISHVGYWGQREDVDTTIDQISMFSDVISRFDNPWYQKVRIANSKKTFKMYLSASKILDNDIFDGIFGKIY